MININKLYNIIFNKFSLALLVIALSTNAVSEVFQLGDVAPRGAPDGQLNAADSLILQRMVLGEIIPTDDEKLIGDVAPLNSPDGKLDAGDLVVQQRAILGLVNLNTIDLSTLPVPILDAIVLPSTSSNPYPISGSTSPNVSINIYVNENVQRQTVSDVNGDFSINVYLYDGSNNIHATVYNATEEGLASNTVSVEYINTINRIQGDASSDGPISVDTVWTPGNPAQAYTISSDLTVASGVQFVIQPGTTVFFDDGTTLKVFGELRVSNEGGQITLTSSNPNPTPGSWDGIVIYGNAKHVIDNALIEWAGIGVRLNTAASNLTIRNTSFLNISGWGVSIENYSGSLTNDTNVLIDNVLIDNTANGVKVGSGRTNVSITNSTIQNISQTGVLFDRADGVISNNTINLTRTAITLRSSSPLITGNILKNSNYGILLYATNDVVSPQIKSNTIISNTTGISINATFSDSNPIIDSRNIITNNGVGVIIERNVGQGVARPKINNNEIHSNSVNIEAGLDTTTIDAKNNWWGTTVVSDIAASINDYTDYERLRVIDYSGFLDAAGGNPATGNYLPPLITQNTILMAGATYQAIGDVSVASGVTLTIEAGAVLQFGTSMDLIIDGTLLVNGTPTNPVIFTSSNPFPLAGDWSGIKLEALSINNVIDGAVVEYAITGIEVKATSNDSLITNSAIRNNSISGIYFNLASGTASNNVINGHTIDSRASGIWVQKASPLIDNNAIYNNLYGIYISRGSSNVAEDTAPQIINNNISNNTDGIYALSVAAQISGNIVTNNSGSGIYISGGAPIVNLGNVITNNKYGIYLGGDTVAVVDGNIIIDNNYGILINANNSTLLQPTITTNDIYNNNIANLYLRKVPGTTALNISNNWWGTDIIVDIRTTITGFASSLDALVLLSSIAPVSNIISAVPYRTLISEAYISPEISPGVKDATTYTATLTRPSNWNVSIYNQAQQLVKTYTGTGLNVNVTWNGSDELLSPVVDGLYRFVLTVDGITTAQYMTVDNTLPVAAITAPLVDQTITSTAVLNIQGSVFDATYNDFKIEMANSLTPAVGDYQTLYTQSNVVGERILPQARVLFTWLYNDINGLQQYGDRTVKLTVTDKAGNISVHAVSFTLDYLTFSNVSITNNKINPYLDENISVVFTLNKPATVKLKIFSELDADSNGGLIQGEELIYEVESNFTANGIKTMSWNGKDSDGNAVRQDFYRYELVETRAVDNNRYYNIPTQTGSSAQNTLDISNMAFSKNIYAKMNVTTPANQVSRVYFNAAGSILPPLSKIVEEGSYTYLFDGRSLDGKFVDIGYSIRNTSRATIYQQDINTIYVKNKAPILLGTELAPNIEIKSNPYRIKHSYDQITKIEFTVDEQSYVTVDLLKPCYYSDATCSTDPAVASVAKLIDNQLLAGSDNTAATVHGFEWRGYDFDNINAETNNILVGEDGLYTYLITATSVATGQVTTYRGSLYLLQ